MFKVGVNTSKIKQISRKGSSNSDPTESSQAREGKMKGL